MYRLPPKFLLWAFALALVIGAIAVLFPQHGVPQRTISFDIVQLPYSVIGYVMFAIAGLFVLAGRLASRSSRFW
jgi:hypothetical protein